MLKEEIYRYIESSNGKNIKLGLEALTAFMKRINWPDKELNIIHITGTNGKGSTSEFINCMLQEAGYKVGSFNSPYFESPCECIRINGEQISEDELVDYMTSFESHLKGLAQEELLPSGFEILTALALQYFKDQKVDFVILEVGLGGNLDATNVISKSLISVFTKIAIDHTQFLGDTIEAIALNKAGIIKEGSKVITTWQDDKAYEVVLNQAKLRQASVTCLNNKEISDIKVEATGTSFNYQGRQYKLQMIGRHQAYNCALALKVIEALIEANKMRITREQMQKGAYKMLWPGRFEKVQHEVEIYLDGAHNLEGIYVLKQTMQALEPAYVIGVVGILKDKEISKMLQIIEGDFDELVVTKPNHIRAMDEVSLTKEASKYIEKIVTVKQADKALKVAINRAKNKNQKVRIICFGSLYMLAEIKKALNKI